MIFFFSSRRRHTRSKRDWSSDVCSSDLKTCEKARARRPSEGRDTRVRAGPLRRRSGCPRPPHTRIETRRSEERRVGKEWRAGGAGGWRKKSGYSDVECVDEDGGLVRVGI